MPQLDVMTFNVRQMDGEDGEQSWEHRKHVLVETLALHHPAIVGTQETWEGQTQFILGRLPGYRAFGQGRFGDTRDKHNKVFYDAGSLELLESGEIWISTTPEVAGSSDWGIPSPRMITWGRVKMREDGLELMLLNTHFPYGRGANEARRQAARLIREKIAGLAVELPIVITGDFNSRAGGEIHETLKRDLSDAWETAATQRGPDGTVHGFGKFREGGRIDWVLYRHAARVLWAETVTHTAGGLYPSDHYPVVARLEFTQNSVAHQDAMIANHANEFDTHANGKVDFSPGVLQFCYDQKRSSALGACELATWTGAPFASCDQRHYVGVPLERAQG